MDHAGDPVRAMWVAYREGDIEGALPLLDPDVEFVPIDGTVYRGRDGIRTFFAGFEARGERFQASPYSFERHGDHGLVIGHRRIRSAQGTEGSPLYFVHLVRNGVITYLSAHATREAAMHVIDEA